MDNTIDYYNKNAEQFVQGILSVDFAATQERFLAKLSVGAGILDFGCGSGRDTWIKGIWQKGYQEEIRDITILTPGTIDYSCIADLLDEEETSDGYNTYSFDGRKYNVTTCIKFKGLEADAILCLI